MGSTSQHLLSGAMSGFASSICLQPFDLLKTRMQQSDYNILRSQNTSILGVAREIVRDKGTLGLWRGTNATIIRNVPGVALYFTGLTKIRTVVAQSPFFSTSQQPSNNGSVLPKLSSQGNLVTGALARTTVGFIMNPFTILKARYESNLHSYGSLSSAFISLVRSGPTEMFRGFLPSVLRDAPYAGLFVLFYESIKHTTSLYIPKDSALASTGSHVISASSASVIATLATHPFDVVKTKMQVRTEQRFHSFFQTVSSTFQRRGMIGFFDGVSLRMSRKVLSSAIGWAVYEGMLMFMRTPANVDR